MLPAHEVRPRERTAAIVLAGGASRRFGSDKTRATHGGHALLELVVDAAAALVDDVTVIGPWSPDGRRHLPEPEPGRGPLAALAHGLRQFDSGRVLVLAADHPQLQPPLLQSLLDQLGAHDAAVPIAHGEPQPLVACYRASVWRTADRLVDGGERRLRALLNTIDVRFLDHDTWRRYDPDGRSFLDVDEPQQLEAMRRSAPERQQLDGIAHLDPQRRGSEHRER